MVEKRIIDRGPTRGHQFLVIEPVSGKRLAAFDSEADAKLFAVGVPKLKKLKGKKK